MSKLFCLRASVINICILLMLVCSCAYADESVQVSIPVIATGADCSVELLDSNHHRVQWLDLERNVPSAFTITCDGLMRFTYQAVIINKDTDTVKYDHTVYTIHVDTYLNAKGQMAYFVTIVNPAASSQKLGMITFNNIPEQGVTPTPSPTPTVTSTPTPVPPLTPAPSQTPIPYDQVFTFTEQWIGASEDSLDWVMYNSDGSVRSKLFDKTVVSDREWKYIAYFQHNVDDCYIIEHVPEGYLVTYVNVGEYADVTDRCHNGGTIINHKIPQTSDPQPIGLHLLCILVASVGLMLLAVSRHRRSIR